MEFFIKRNASLPLLKLQVVKDGRSSFNNMMDLIQTSAIFFSMVDVETGIPKINNRPAGIVAKTLTDPNAEPEYYVYYQFRTFDTRKPGRYEGQFIFISDEGTLILPIREKLFINIQESFVAENLSAGDGCYQTGFPCCAKPSPTIPVTTTTTTSPIITSTPLITETPTPTPTSTPTITPTSTPTPTPTNLSLFEVEIETIVMSGSVIVDFNVYLPYIIESDYSCDITKSLNVISGNSFVVSSTINVPAGEISGTTRVIIDDDYNRIAEGSELLMVVQNAENLNVQFGYVKNAIKYNFIPKPNPQITRTPTPTPTQTPTPTPTPTQTPTPTPTPSNSYVVPPLPIYYGKDQNLFINSNDLNYFDFISSETIKGKYLSYEEQPGFCYLVVPQNVSQPKLFKNSVDGCNGFTIPFARLDDINVVDSDGNVNIYYVYRSFVSTSANVDVWVCD